MATTDPIGAPVRADHPASKPEMTEADRLAHESASHVRPAPSPLPRETTARRHVLRVRGW